MLVAVLCACSIASGSYYPHFHDYIWLEAECGDLWNPGISAPDGSASCDAYLTTTPNCGTSRYSPGPKLARYTFQSPHNAYHACYIWARVKYSSHLHNMVWLSVDSQNAVPWQFSNYQLNQWHWERINIAALTQGHHSFEIRLGEEKVCIDKFMVTCDPHYVPAGLGMEAENQCKPDPQCADLVVTHVEFNPPQPVAGETVQVKLTVANQGDAPADDFVISWMVSHSAHYSYTFRRKICEVYVAPGDTYTACVDFSCHYVGCYSFTVELDSEEDVDECDESNNKYGPVEICVGEDPTCVHVYHWLEAECGDIQDPGESGQDLLASDHYFLTTPKNCGNWLYHPGPKIAEYKLHLHQDCQEDYYLWARVRYDNSNHNSFWLKLDHQPDVKWQLDDNLPWHLKGKWNWQRINIGPLAEGPHTLWLKVREEQTDVDKLLITNDPDFTPQGLGEEAENRCKPQDRCPDLCVASINIFPQTAKVGEPVQAKIVVHNQGNESANGFVIQWRLVHAQGHLPLHSSGKSKPITLAPGAQYTLCIDFSCHIAGCYLLNVDVDPHQHVDECDEDNNSAGPIEVCVDPYPVCDDEYHWLEAECGQIFHPCQQYIDHGASQFRYVSTPPGSGHYLFYPGPVMGKYTFTTEDACGKDFYVWARVCYSSTLYNSLWITVDYTTHVKWLLDDHRLFDWHWERIKIGPLSPGSHNLCLKHREEQTHVDKILITNDENFVPQGHGQPGTNCHPW
jgi:hypothetical protein